MAFQIADVLLLLIPLVIILLGCELFTNGIEWLGVKLGLAESCVGSVLAAVGTALPETTVPIVAIIFATNGAGQEIAAGAIIGAPFMLATLAMFAGGLAIFISYMKGRRMKHLSITPEHFGRDTRNFMIIYILAFLAALLFSGSGSEKYVRYVIAVALVFFYAIYLRKMLADNSDSNACPAELYICRPFTDLRKEEPPTRLVILQVLASLGMILIGARIFVSDIEHIATELNVTEMILAFLIAPVATELPEKFNSILWYWRGKDTLAMGNITGAMVFQGSIPVSIGLVFTPWSFDNIHLASMIFALFAIGLISLEMKIRKRISYRTLLVSGIFYLVYILLLISESASGNL